MESGEKKHLQMARELKSKDTVGFQIVPLKQAQTRKQIHMLRPTHMGPFTMIFRQRTCTRPAAVWLRVGLSRSCEAPAGSSTWSETWLPSGAGSMVKTTIHRTSPDQSYQSHSHVVKPTSLSFPMNLLVSIWQAARTERNYLLFKTSRTNISLVTAPGRTGAALRQISR